MAAGTNQGGNLNLYLFEVVVITRDPVTGREQVKTVGIHPLVRVPAQITYIDTSRAAVVQTASDSVVNRGGRAFRRVNMTGAWGVESVGLLPYIGTGEVRAQRFYNEVVRMSDAITKEQVDECVNVLTGTPLVKLLLAPYFARPNDAVFGVNFYDFWHDRRFSCVIRSYQDTVGRFSATGLIQYQLSIEESGPIITGSAATAVLNALFDALTTWNQINQVLESYTVQTLVDSAFAVVGIGLTQLNRSLDAVVGQIEAVTGLLGGFQDSGNENLSAFLANSAECDRFAQDVADALENARQPKIDSNATQGTWDASADLDAAQRNLWLSDRLDEIEDLSDAARFQAAAGVFFGMSREDYVRFLGSGGEAARRVRGTVPYEITEFDTEQSLEDLFGIDFDAILARNGLDPDEALVPGTLLEIPITREAPQGSERIDGLPTFGSHVGRAAWGSDCTVELDTDADGDFVVIDDTDVLLQGIDWLVEEDQDDLLRVANDVPDVAVAAAVKIRITNLIETDQRISSVDEVDVVVGGGAVAVQLTATAINSGTITTAGAA